MMLTDRRQRARKCNNCTPWPLSFLQSKMDAVITLCLTVALYDLDTPRTVTVRTLDLEKLTAHDASC